MISGATPEMPPRFGIGRAAAQIFCTEHPQSAQNSKGHDVTTTNQAIDAISRRLGFPKSRARTIARRLTEGGILPSGAPGVAPEIDIADFVSLLVGLACDAALPRVVAAVSSYDELTPEGVPAESVPVAVRHQVGFASARTHLEGLAYLALRDAAAVSKLHLEFVANWPEFAIHNQDGRAERFLSPGALSGHWQASGHRKSTTINGAAFVDAVRDLFGGK